VKIAKALLCFFDDRHGNCVIGSAFHHPMVQDEAVLVLDQRWRRNFGRWDKWKLCGINPGPRPENAG